MAINLSRETTLRLNAVTWRKHYPVEKLAFMLKPNSLHAVTTLTPLRVSFAGGGSDFPEFNKFLPGLVVSMAIRQYIYVTVKRHSPLFGERYRISYSETEHADSLAEIQNDIARACIELVGVDEPLFVSTASDLPAMSGLGSSSSFAVGLLNALHLLVGETVSAGQLAEEACQVELEMLGKPIGKQDQYAAAFGGLNAFEFRVDGRVSVDALTLDPQTYNLLDDLVMLWTGVQRTAVSVLEEQNQRTVENHDSLSGLVQLAQNFKSQLIGGILTRAQLGALLTSGWALKRELASNVTSEFLDATFEACINAGALGGKLLGAGGGGFLLMCVPQDGQEKFRRRVAPLPLVPVELEVRGSQVLSQVLA